MSAITGGEPLVRKGIVEFIASLNRVGGIEDISLTTNGVLLGRYGGKAAGGGDQAPQHQP